MSFKTLIFIVSYNAESHIEQVLERISDDLWRNDNLDVLISDDASVDNTIGIFTLPQF